MQSQREYNIVNAEVSGWMKCIHDKYELQQYFGSHFAFNHGYKYWIIFIWKV